MDSSASWHVEITSDYRSIVQLSVRTTEPIAKVQLRAKSHLEFSIHRIGGWCVTLDGSFDWNNTSRGEAAARTRHRRTLAIGISCRYRKRAPVCLTMMMTRKCRERRFYWSWLRLVAKGTPTHNRWETRASTSATTHGALASRPQVVPDIIPANASQCGE
jgi:hypothetical protein